MAAELKRLHNSTSDSMVGEMNHTFQECITKLFRVLAELDPQSDAFLNAEAMNHIMDLTQSPIDEAEFDIANSF